MKTDIGKGNRDFIQHKSVLIFVKEIVIFWLFTMKSEIFVDGLLFAMKLSVLYLQWKYLDFLMFTMKSDISQQKLKSCFNKNFIRKTFSVENLETDVLNNKIKTLATKK